MPRQEHEPSREQGGPRDPVPTLLLVYEPNPKHKSMPTPGRRGSSCPRHADGPGLLRSSDLLGSKRYATDGENAYCAQRHDPGNVPNQQAWHGYPVGWEEVPPLLVAQWVAEEKVQRRTVHRAKRLRER
jgi:hypothetical protein